MIMTTFRRAAAHCLLIVCATFALSNAWTADLPITVIPDKSKYDSEKGKALLDVTLQRLEVAKMGCQLIFIGDSITAGWMGSNGKEVWDHHFSKYQPLDYGIGGDRTQHVLWRLENPDLAAIHPKVAVLLIGTNNRTDSAADIATGVKAVINKTQTVFPGITIILHSIMPNQRATDLMASANETIKTFADGNQVILLDIAALMTKEGDNWKGLDADKLHLTKAGYQLWANALDPLLEKLLP
jgi:lysophospholipase L1-like esterase